MYGLPYAFSHIIQTHAAEGILEDKLHPGKLANRVSACHECQALFLGICCSLAGNRVLRLTLCLPLNLSTRWIGAWELSQCCQVMPCLFTHTHTLSTSFYKYLEFAGSSQQMIFTQSVQNTTHWRKLARKTAKIWIAASIWPCHHHWTLRNSQCRTPGHAAGTIYKWYIYII